MRTMALVSFQTTGTWGISLLGLAPLIATGNGDYLLGMNNDVGCLAFPENILFLSCLTIQHW